VSKGQPPELSPTTGTEPSNRDRGASSFIHIGLGWPVAAPLTLPFSLVAMRLGPVLAGPEHSCVGAAGRFAAVWCWGGGGGREG